MMSWMKTAPLLLLSVMLLWTNWQRMTQQEQLIEREQKIRLADASQQAYLTLHQHPAVTGSAAYRRRPKLTSCQLPTLQPQTNEDLSRALLENENAWHQCAAQVDMTISCQERINAQSTTHP